MDTLVDPYAQEIRCDAVSQNIDLIFSCCSTKHVLLGVFSGLPLYVPACTSEGHNCRDVPCAHQYHGCTLKRHTHTCRQDGVLPHVKADSKISIGQYRCCKRLISQANLLHYKVVCLSCTYVHVFYCPF